VTSPRQQMTPRQCCRTVAIDCKFSGRVDDNRRARQVNVVRGRVPSLRPPKSSRDGGRHTPRMPEQRCQCNATWSTRFASLNRSARPSPTRLHRYSCTIPRVSESMRAQLFLNASFRRSAAFNPLMRTTDSDIKRFIRPATERLVLRAVARGPTRTRHHYADESKAFRQMGPDNFRACGSIQGGMEI